VKNIKSYKDYKPEKEYEKSTRREVNLDVLRKSKDYKDIIKMGFKETTSHQQELNNTLKFERKKEKQKEKGKGKTFYTVHPSGIVRRYNPDKSKEIPQGSGNDLINFGIPLEAHGNIPKDLNI
jgi:CRISPR/Cas system-associated endonuclease/helicase Cas3